MPPLGGRVRQAHAPLQARPSPPSADAEEANPFVCDANEAVVFKLVRSSAEIPTAEAFEPEFTHQIFRDDETIFGYRELSVVIHTQAHLFKSYVHISYAEKIKSALNPADDILGMLKKHLGDDVTTDPAVFDAWLAADADAPLPPGARQSPRGRAPTAPSRRRASSASPTPPSTHGTRVSNPSPSFTSTARPPSTRRMSAGPC